MSGKFLTGDNLTIAGKRFINLVILLSRLNDQKGNLILIFLLSAAVYPKEVVYKYLIFANFHRINHMFFVLRLDVYYHVMYQESLVLTIIQ